MVAATAVVPDGGEASVADAVCVRVTEVCEAAAVTVTVGSFEVTGCPPIVAVIVILPATVAVNVAVYVPFPSAVSWSKVPWAVPFPRPNTGTQPASSRLLPLASRSVRVTVICAPNLIGLDVHRVIVDFDVLVVLGFCGSDEFPC